MKLGGKDCSTLSFRQPLFALLLHIFIVPEISLGSPTVGLFWVYLTVLQAGTLERDTRGREREREVIPALEQHGSLTVTLVGGRTRGGVI